MASNRIDPGIDGELLEEGERTPVVDTLQDPEEPAEVHEG